MEIAKTLVVLLALTPWAEGRPAQDALLPAPKAQELIKRATERRNAIRTAIAPNEKLENGELLRSPDGNYVAIMTEFAQFEIVKVERGGRLSNPVAPSFTQPPVDDVSRGYVQLDNFGNLTRYFAKGARSHFGSGKSVLARGARGKRLILGNDGQLKFVD